MTQQGCAVEAGEAADDRRIVAEVAVAVDLEPVGEDVLDVVEGEGAVDVAGELGALPAAEVGEDLFAQLLGLLLQLLDVAGEIDLFRGIFAQFANLLLQLDERFFKIQIELHRLLLDIGRRRKARRDRRPPAFRPWLRYSKVTTL